MKEIHEFKFKIKGDIELSYSYNERKSLIKYELKNRKPAEGKTFNVSVVYKNYSLLDKSNKEVVIDMSSCGEYNQEKFCTYFNILKEAKLLAEYIDGYTDPTKGFNAYLEKRKS